MGLQKQMGMKLLQGKTPDVLPGGCGCLAEEQDTRKQQARRLGYLCSSNSGGKIFLHSNAPQDQRISNFPTLETTFKNSTGLGPVNFDETFL